MEWRRLRHVPKPQDISPVHLSANINIKIRKSYPLVPKNAKGRRQLFHWKTAFEFPTFFFCSWQITNSRSCQLPNDLKLRGGLGRKTGGSHRGREREISGGSYKREGLPLFDPKIERARENQSYYRLRGVGVSLQFYERHTCQQEKGK